MENNKQHDDALENIELQVARKDEEQEEEEEQEASFSELPVVDDEEEEHRYASAFQEQDANVQGQVAAAAADFAELPVLDDNEEEEDKQEVDAKTNKISELLDAMQPPIRRTLVGTLSLSHRGKSKHRMSFIGRMSDGAAPTQKMFGTNNNKNKARPRKARRTKSDPYFDYTELKQELITFHASPSTGGQTIEVDIPSLVTCKRQFHNKPAEKYRSKSAQWHWRIADTCMNILASFYIYLCNICGVESAVMIANTSVATYYFCRFRADHATKLDFAFLSLAVVFPLTFLIQTTFQRRDLALSRLVDFKSAILSSSLFELSVDWASKDGGPVGGRAQLPDNFNENVLKDYNEFLQLVYQFLSMPSVSHARYIVFFQKQAKSKHVHALQNDLLKQINDTMFDMMMHTEIMRSAGFSSGEASRLHQYHQYMQTRFEQLRIVKNYRTPQATRSFGRAYIFFLPWLCGPYFAWVYQTTSLTYSIVLAVFTFLILLGLLNTQQGMEDPFVADVRSWTPGIDSVKLDYELSTTLQAICQYYANAELHRMWTREKKG